MKFETAVKLETFYSYFSPNGNKLITALLYIYFRVTLGVCSHSSGARNDQTFSFTYKKDVHLGVDPPSSLCWDVQSGDGAPILTYPCHGQGGNQLWKYNLVSFKLEL